MARYLLLFFTLLFTGSVAFAQTSLSGKVLEEGSGLTAIGANITLHKNGNYIGGTTTDFDGNYSFSNIDPGTYDVKATYVGYSDQLVEGVVVLAGKAISLDFKLIEGVTLQTAVVIAYKAPLIEQDNTTQGKVITGDDIKNLPTRNINALASSAAGTTSADEGDAVAIRGSRSDATAYYVDGVRVQGTSLVPESEIDQLQVITGGIGAQYGDVSGGIISITTKGPSGKFSGGIEAETSQFLDAYNNNLIGFNLSGPILKNSKGNSILGFRLSGRYTYLEDDDPSAVSVFRVKDEKLAELEANPVIDVGGDRLVAADFLTDEDVNVLKAQPFEDRTRIDVNAKIDARLSDAIDISIGGFYSSSDNMFTPNEASSTAANWRLLNAQNNPTNKTNTYRGNFRFRHRLGGSEASAEGEEGAKASVIRNVSYTLQAGYENNLTDLTDPRHGTNYFDYGHVGQLDFEWVPFYTASFDTTTGMFIPSHADYSQILRQYTPSTINPILANYNNLLGIETGEGLNSSVGEYIIAGGGEANLISRTDFLAYNGTVSSVFNDSWGYHTNVGTVYNRAQKADNKIYTFNANAAFDLVPGSSDDGRHNIQLGITYEQRINRNYRVSPRNLWNLARQKANEHIQGIPFDEDGNVLADTIGWQTVIFNGIEMERPLYELAISESPDNLFYKNLRASLGGIPLNEFVNTDGLSPDQLSLDMFSAKELNDEGILDYYGYDYLGNLYDGNFNDFFTATDENGVRTFPVAPARPIYTAAFIQDKFKYKDVIFRVGVRVDRYDANTKVLKDKYSLYEIMGADEFHGIYGGTQPGNIGEDFKVYIEGDGGNVQAYRDEDDWYLPNGTPVNDASLIFPGGLVTPQYKDERIEDDPNFIKSRDFDPSVSFEDYEVQVNIMPRLAFSFPISEEANFFAHYDVLVQRPPSNSIASPRDYFYFTDEAGATKNNPNLRPDRTVDYEVGFQQRLSNTSALKISAYYKELRDMITFRTITPVPVVGAYTTYDNLDFGTVKGFSFQYDLRRTGNVTLLANYTLQFADGTGSDANSSRGISSRGVIRTLSPLSFDERHRFNFSVDYRYKSGNKYNGPELFDLPIFANTGLNLQLIAVSGRPYTANKTPLELSGSQISGAINGARKPWNTTINLRIDKTFTLTKNYHFNVYLRVSNVLDQRNVINVYPASGAPDDDGFLRSSRGLDKLQTIQNSKREVNAFLASHQWRILNPNYFSLPRRIFIGASFNF